MPEVLKDRYRLDRVLGRGGMAAVWLGHDEVLDRPVAVKLLSDAIADDPDFLARFRREATVAGGVSHPSLVDVYDYSEGEERPYLVMEFVPGESLAELIARDQPVDRGRLAEELLGAVAHIHEAGILHRDIKPQNIVFDADGTAKLIDFGIALPRDATALTQTGLVLGTERYTAPEVMAGEAATERSDLYSCGVVLRSCQAEGSTALEALLGRLLSPDPQQRPFSARQALAQLERAPEPGEPTAAFEPTRASGVDRAPLERPPTRRRWAAAAALVALVVAIGLAVALAGGSGDGGEAQAPKEAAGNGTQSNGDVGSVKSPAADSEPPAPSGGDPALATSLNDEGYELLQAGRYEAAIPKLEESVSTFPPGTDDINYAYALFNLGNALRLSGRAAEAIPILEQRLEIADQTGAVAAELEAARREAG
ncbi:MAG TPA: serine/threonine-protein kinase [Solirubrobacterales bacterium]|jgi:serine/threonine-protein kinase|nr:serine/threonine-protein kinase [Solirubrobacterales bacterium]